MKNFTIYLAFALCLLAGKAIAQESFEGKARAIANKIEKVTEQEKEALKKGIEKVNDQLEKGEINAQQAEAQKKQLAETHAANIENQVNPLEQELRDLVQQKVDGKIKGESFDIYFNFKERDSLHRNRSEARTTSQFVFAIGLNNVVTDGSVENSDYKFWGSRFYEWGMTYNTRLAQNSNLLHLKYGFSVMYNDLRPTDNRIFVANGNQTALESGPVDYSDVRFRNVYLVAPLNFEFDFTPKREKDGKTIFRTHESFRFGLGGYAGVRIKSKQKTEFEIDDVEYQEKAKGDFNASNFIYGLSAYIGHKSTSLYVKYDLNDLFQHNALQQNNVSLGVRFDFN